MKIEILGYKDLLERLKAEPDALEVIYIGMPWSDTWKVRDYVIDKAKDYLILPFDDVESKMDGYEEPKEMHVQSALDWAKGREHVIVACRAGISRSSAIAYTLKCAEATPEEATEILTRGRHYPNRLILKLGSEILNKPTMEKAVHDWHLA